ncbi:MAG: hypothetical protein DHS20C15_30910 [Planctomycetota bacterium]|nr:MAG: hypothetical protein DHS20C15_30910 [Planctomycetota bacterium]
MRHVSVSSFLVRFGVLLVLAAGFACQSDVAKQVPPAPVEPAPAEETVSWNEATSDVPARKVQWRVIDHDEVPRNEAFSMEVRVLSGESPTSLQRLDLKGWMPDHGHGFVQDPSVSTLDIGHYRVDGVLLHMRGTWELRLQLFDANGLDVVVIELEL